MNADPEQFEQVRRLLALKRHEQPPPGYFKDFSDRVMARIEAGEQGGSRETWFQRFWAMLESKPIFAGAFGSAVCAVLISGILNSEEAGVSGFSSADAPLTAQSSPAFGVTGASGNMYNNPQLASTNPISSLFNQYQLPTQPTSFTFGKPGGN